MWGLEVMGSVTAAKLLELWSFRLKMARDGRTHPSDHGLSLIKQLVQKLSEFEGEELVEIDEVGGDEALVRFIRVSTGEVFAEARVDPGLGRLQPDAASTGA